MSADETFELASTPSNARGDEPMIISVSPPSDSRFTPRQNRDTLNCLVEAEDITPDTYNRTEPFDTKKSDQDVSMKSVFVSDVLHGREKFETSDTLSKIIKSAPRNKCGDAEIRNIMQGTMDKILPMNQPFGDIDDLKSGLPIKTKIIHVKADPVKEVLLSKVRIERIRRNSEIADPEDLLSTVAEPSTVLNKIEQPSAVLNRIEPSAVLTKAMTRVEIVQKSPKSERKIKSTNIVRARDAPPEAKDESTETQGVISVKTGSSAQPEAKDQSIETQGFINVKTKSASTFPASGRVNKLRGIFENNSRSSDRSDDKLNAKLNEKLNEKLNYNAETPPSQYEIRSGSGSYFNKTESASQLSQYLDSQIEGIRIVCESVKDQKSKTTISDFIHKRKRLQDVFKGLCLLIHQLQIEFDTNQQRQETNFEDGEANLASQETRLLKYNTKIAFLSQVLTKLLIELVADEAFAFDDSFVLFSLKCLEAIGKAANNFLCTHLIDPMFVGSVLQLSKELLIDCYDNEALQHELPPGRKYTTRDSFTRVLMAQPFVYLAKHVLQSCGEAAKSTGFVYNDETVAVALGFLEYMNNWTDVFPVICENLCKHYPQQQRLKSELVDVDQSKDTKALFDACSKLLQRKTSKDKVRRNVKKVRWATHSQSANLWKSRYNKQNRDNDDNTAEDVVSEEDRDMEWNSRMLLQVSSCLLAICASNPEARHALIKDKTFHNLLTAKAKMCPENLKSIANVLSAHYRFFDMNEAENLSIYIPESSDSSYSDSFGDLDELSIIGDPVSWALKIPSDINKLETNKHRLAAALAITVKALLRMDNAEELINVDTADQLFEILQALHDSALQGSHAGVIAEVTNAIADLATFDQFREMCVKRGLPLMNMDSYTKDQKCADSYLKMLENLFMMSGDISTLNDSMRKHISNTLHQINKSGFGDGRIKELQFIFNLQRKKSLSLEEVFRILYTRFMSNISIRCDTDILCRNLLFFTNNRVNIIITGRGGRLKGKESEVKYATWIYRLLSFESYNAIVCVDSEVPVLLLAVLTDDSASTSVIQFTVEAIVEQTRHYEIFRKAYLRNEDCASIVMNTIVPIIYSEFSNEDKKKYLLPRLELARTLSNNRKTFEKSDTLTPLIELWKKCENQHATTKMHKGTTPHRNLNLYKNSILNELSASIYNDQPSPDLRGRIESLKDEIIELPFITRPTSPLTSITLEQANLLSTELKDKMQLSRIHENAVLGDRTHWRLAFDNSQRHFSRQPQYDADEETSDDVLLEAIFATIRNLTSPAYPEIIMKENLPSRIKKYLQIPETKIRHIPSMLFLIGCVASKGQMKDSLYQLDILGTLIELLDKISALNGRFSSEVICNVCLSMASLTMLHENNAKTFVKDNGPRLITDLIVTRTIFKDFNSIEAIATLICNICFMNDDLKSEFGYQRAPFVLVQILDIFSKLERSPELNRAIVSILKAIYNLSLNPENVVRFKEAKLQNCIETYLLAIESFDDPIVYPVLQTLSNIIVEYSESTTEAFHAVIKPLLKYLSNEISVNVTLYTMIFDKYSAVIQSS